MGGGGFPRFGRQNYVTNVERGAGGKFIGFFIGI